MAQAVDELRREVADETVPSLRSDPLNLSKPHLWCLSRPSPAPRKLSLVFLPPHFAPSSSPWNAKTFTIRCSEPDPHTIDAKGSLGSRLSRLERGMGELEKNRKAYAPAQVLEALQQEVADSTVRGAPPLSFLLTFSPPPFPSPCCPRYFPPITRAPSLPPDPPNPLGLAPLRVPLAGACPVWRRALGSWRRLQRPTWQLRLLRRCSRRSQRPQTLRWRLFPPHCFSPPPHLILQVSPSIPLVPLLTFFPPFHRFIFFPPFICPFVPPFSPPSPIRVDLSDGSCPRRIIEILPICVEPSPPLHAGLKDLPQSAELAEHPRVPGREGPGGAWGASGAGVPEAGGGHPGGA